MPIPEPRSGESEQDFVSRCIPTQVEEGKSQEIAAGICFSTFREAARTRLRTSARKLNTRLAERVHRPEDRKRKKKR
ncbi:hypothetical protein LCGC14_0273340 [marine sediment metagenome]|uniref:Uncharacterized protein n=2 Tax=root TaxID=1 RepID=A0A9C9THK8_9HYPH|nr:hypothetical protein [Aurantimonas coralicida]